MTNKYKVCQTCCRSFRVVTLQFWSMLAHAQGMQVRDMACHLTAARTAKESILPALY